MAKASIEITGLTCGHCVKSVTEELEAIGANDVIVDLVKDGVSTAKVFSDAPLSDAQISEAISEAGYEVVGIAR